MGVHLIEKIEKVNKNIHININNTWSYLHSTEINIIFDALFILRVF